MNALVLGFCLFGLPPDSDRGRLAPGVCAREQMARCEALCDRLEFYRGMADRKEPAEAALAEAHFYLNYWRTLHAAREDWDEGTRRRLLGTLRGLVGPEAYAAGWSPPPCPELPVLVPVMPPADTSSANGR